MCNLQPSVLQFPVSPPEPDATNEILWQSRLHMLAEMERVKEKKKVPAIAGLDIDFWGSDVKNIGTESLLARFMKRRRGNDSMGLSWAPVVSGLFPGWNIDFRGSDLKL